MRALGERRYADARTALLQAVNLDPSFAGAWLDLAIATHATGDPVQAEEFLNILEARFTLPEPIAAGVASLRQRIHEQTARTAEALDTGVWRWRGTAQGGGGYDSNANAGLSLTDLTLTLPGGGVLLPIDPSLRPRSDSYATASLTADGVTGYRSGQLEVAASAKTRNNSHEQAFNTVEAQAGVGFASNVPAFGGYWARALPGPWRVGATAQQLRLGGSALLNSVAFSALHAWTQLPCSPQGALEVDFRDFPVAPNLDSRLVWLSAGLTCPSPWPRFGTRMGATLRLGHESARQAYESVNGRPGDNTRHVEASVNHQWSWAGASGTHTLEAQLQWVNARDTAGYSPLLSSNARRDVRRFAAGLSYGMPLAWPSADGTWRALLVAQTFRQRSNLEVFRVQGQVAQITIQKTW